MQPVRFCQDGFGPGMNALAGSVAAIDTGVVARSRRVLFVVNNAAFFESHRLPVAQRAQQSGYTVSLCTGHEASATLARHAMPRLAAAGLLPHRVAFRSASINPMFELIGLVQLILHVFRTRPDVLHCASPKGVLYGGIAARLAGTPALVMAISGMGYAFTRGSGASSTTGSGRDGLLRRLVRGVHQHLSGLAFGHANKRVIVQNDEDYRILCETGLARPDEVRLIRGSGVVLNRFVHLPLVPPGGREPLVVLPARLLRDKGVVEFAEAAQRLRAQIPGWRFVLVGTADYDNPSAVPLEQIQQWQQQGVLEWWGHVEDMATLYGRAAIVCLPSYREGMPRALLEAAAAGCAVVTTDAIGCREAIEPGITGDLVPPHDANALAAALLALIHDAPRRRRYGNAGRERAVRCFGIETVLDDTLALYEELLPQSARHEAA